MGIGQYKLEGKIPIPCDDTPEWKKWMEESKNLKDPDHPEQGTLRHIRCEVIAERYRVSTIFLGRDHNFGIKPPLLFETMIFDLHADNKWIEIYGTRYSTWELALEGHEKAVKWLKENHL